jgi:hypothetical protein
MRPEATENKGYVQRVCTVEGGAGGFYDSQLGAYRKAERLQVGG